MVAIPLAPLSPAEQPLVVLPSGSEASLTSLLPLFVLPSGSEAFLPKQQEIPRVLAHPRDDLRGFRPSAIPF